MRTIADKGSTLQGLDVRVLGAILTVALVLLFAFDVWRRRYEDRHNPPVDPQPEPQDDRAWRDRHESS